MPKSYTKPLHSRNTVNKAGDIFVSANSNDLEREMALQIINNWRVSHNFPLNTFQMRLRKLSRNINQDSLVAQRIKRLASIRHKLERFPNMKMAQIQDIGGCRAIMKDITEVDQLVNKYKHNSRGIKHKLYKEQDYIISPKDSGYRGVHLIYQYHSDKSKDYDGMKIEIQIRTLIQHAWATAVEIVGTFIKQSLKSSQGEKSWLRFFALMGSAMAIAESKPTVPNTPNNLEELRKEIISLSSSLDVGGHLAAFRRSIEVLVGERTIPNAHYYLLELDSLGGTVTIRGYAQTQLAIASADYMALEKRIAYTNKDAVLVSADSIESLRLAYPNYYLDANLFLQHLQNVTNPKGKTNQLSLF